MTNYKKTTDAVKYCELGYHVLPLAENAKIPLKGSKGAKDASNDPEKVREHLSRFPKLNWGIAAKNFIGIDIDNKGGKNGSADLAEMEAELGILPKGPKVLTPTGGFHHYFFLPSVKIIGTVEIVWKGRKTGIDLRIGNQYLVAPPSIVGGKPYQWTDPLVPVDQLPKLPQAWIDFLAKPAASKKTVSVVQPVPLVDAPANSDRQKQIESCRKYVAKLPSAISGQNGHVRTFHVANVIFGKFGLTEAEGFPILQEYNRRCQPEWSEAELRHKMEGALAQASQSAPGIVSFGNTLDLPGEDDEPDEKVRTWVPFPIDLLPDPLPAFVQTSATSIGCDPALIVVPLLAGLAAAIGNCRAVRLKGDTGDPWDEPSILWTISVAISGAKKTPGLNAIKKRFREHEHKAKQDYEIAKKRFDFAMSEFEKTLKEHLMRQESGQNGSGKPPAMPRRPINNEIIIEDVTIEALIQRLAENQKGLFLIRDELSGWLRGFGRYSKGGDSDSPFYLECYQAGPYSTTRKTTSSSSVNRCSVSVTGTIQPRVLAGFLMASDATDNGFVQRFLMAMPPTEKAYWSFQKADGKAVQDIQNVFDELLMLPFVQFSDGEPEVMELAQDACQFFIAEHDRIEDEKAVERSDLIRGFLSKHCAKVARLAMIFQCVKDAAGNGSGPRLTIDADSLKRAIDVAKWFFDESSRCMTILGCVQRDGTFEAEKKFVFSIIKTKGPITKRDIKRASSKTMNVAGALASLLTDKRIVQRENKLEGKGRPSVVFEVKPKDTIDKNDTIAPASEP